MAHCRQSASANASDALINSRQWEATMRGSKPGSKHKPRASTRSKCSERSQKTNDNQDTRINRRHQTNLHAAGRAVDLQRRGAAHLHKKRQQMVKTEALQKWNPWARFICDKMSAPQTATK
jgi:hypothetical protein